MEGINNNLDSTGLLLSQMQSNAALKKAGANAPEQNEGVGNILQNFGSLLQDQMGQINALQGQANQAMQTYAVGGDIELHNVILAAEKADMALQLAMQVRNKVIAAYQEISHMNI